MSTTLPDGLVAIVKRDCPTCQLVVPVLGQLAEGEEPLTVFTQDDPTFPEELHPVDDTSLEVSLALDLDTVPTVVRVTDGHEVARIVGWSRDEWEAFTGRAGLGDGLPPHRPGCGSLTQDPDFAATRAAAEGAARLNSRRIELGEHEDEMESMFERGWSDGLPLVPPTPARGG
ncbi:MAG: thioredoxin family protein, partial [Acidimicrobiia bacterium]